MPPACRRDCASARCSRPPNSSTARPARANDARPVRPTGLSARQRRCRRAATRRGRSISSRSSITATLCRLASKSRCNRQMRRTREFLAAEAPRRRHVQQALFDEFADEGRLDATGAGELLQLEPLLLAEAGAAQDDRFFMASPGRRDRGSKASSLAIWAYRARLVARRLGQHDLEHGVQITRRAAGILRPRRRSLRPPCEPAGTASSTRPSGVGTGTVAPRAAPTASRAG